MQQSTPARPATNDILAMMRLGQIGKNKFEGLSPDTGNARVFGGQLIGQGLIAASHTVEDLDLCPAHSLHSHFFRPAASDLPILYEVDRVRDSKSFRTRTVRASQRGKSLLTLMVSYHRKEEGYEHHDPMPVVPPAESIVKISAEEAARRRKNLPQDLKDKLAKPEPMVARFVTPRQMLQPVAGEPDLKMWWQGTAVPSLPSPDDGAAHQAVLAYTSDLSFMDTPLIPHGVSLMSPRVQGATIDHSIWFHEPVDMNRWHLFSAHSSWAAHGRGYIRGEVFTEAGKLVTTLAQECLIRRLAA